MKLNDVVKMLLNEAKIVLKEITANEASNEFEKYVKLLHGAGLYRQVKAKVFEIFQSEQKLPGKFYDNFLKFAVVLIGRLYQKYEVDPSAPTERFEKLLDSHVKKIYASYISNRGQETTEDGTLQPYTRSSEEVGKFVSKCRLAFGDMFRSISSEFGESGKTAVSNLSASFGESLKSASGSKEELLGRLKQLLVSLKNMLRINGAELRYDSLRFRDANSRATIKEILSFVPTKEVVPEPEQKEPEQNTPQLDSQVLRRQGEQQKYVTPKRRN